MKRISIIREGRHIYAVTDGIKQDISVQCIQESLIVLKELFDEFKKDPEYDKYFNSDQFLCIRCPTPVPNVPEAYDVAKIKFRR